MRTPARNRKVEAIHVAWAFVFLVPLMIFCYGAHLPLVIPILLFFLAVHLFYFENVQAKLFLNLGLLLALIIFISDAVVQYTGFHRYYIPVSCVAMLTILLFNDLELAFLMALISSILVSLKVGLDLPFVIIFFIGSLTGIYAVKDARTRGKLFEAGLFIGLIQALGFILLNPSREVLLNKAFLIYSLRPLFINGFVAVFVVMVSLKIFEWLFGVVTNFSLLEISDFNQPLLKRMVLEAPGTYHHSLIVSNISEAAADSIGANALLARVGAYYHDIGKLNKPEYFAENQMIEGNKHDNLEPNISRLVIANHVKDGVELAKKYKLSQQIIEFIPQHHGTSLIYYFYQRALEDAQEKVDEANFRYEGPKPQSREAAIVLLADSVEGAVRSLTEPTLSRIEEMVHKVINNKFIDGQLDECDLTLKDINKISDVFTRTLGAIYHSRIQYPERKNGSANPSRKSTEKSSAKSQPDSKDRKKDSLN